MNSNPPFSTDNNPNKLHFETRFDNTPSERVPESETETKQFYFFVFLIFVFAASYMLFENYWFV